MRESAQKLHVNKIAIVGNPNVGKSALFNQITNAYSLESNAPYTTIAVHRAEITIDGIRYEVIDTPGIVSLDVQTEDGLITRSILLDEHPEIIVVCMSCINVKRSLLLLAQMLELDIPIVLALTFVDEALQKGITLRQDMLAELTGLPVVGLAASGGQGVKDLLRILPRAAVSDKARIRYSKPVEDGLEALIRCFPLDAIPADATLLLALQGDPGMQRFIQTHYGEHIHERVHSVAAQVRRRAYKDIARSLFDERNRWAEAVTAEVLSASDRTAGRAGVVLGALCRHPVWGWLILAAVIYVAYLLVGRFGINVVVAGLEGKLFNPALEALGRSIPWPLLQDFLVGHYGVLTTGLANAIATALPILTIFFIILNVLEDTGYIPNLCVLTNRFFKRLGLSGKAILPIILGFGCKTMATLTTRILESRKERFIAIFLIAFAIPCAPLLGINLAVLALYPFGVFVAVFGVLLIIEIAAGIILNAVIRSEHTSDFILEIPPLRLPSLRNLTVKTWYRLKWFTLEAVPLFMIGACILFGMEKLYVLDFIKQTLLPVFVSYLHLPLSTVDAFLICLLRKEAGAVMVLDLALSGELDPVQAMVAIIIVNCFIPCFANIMAMIRQLGAGLACAMALVIATVSAIIAGAVNYIFRLAGLF